MSFRPVFFRVILALAAAALLSGAGAGEAGPRPVDGPVLVPRAHLPPAPQSGAPAAVAATLYDQLAAAAEGVSAQNFEASFNAFDSRAADDFTIPDTVGSWQIDGLEIGGQYLGGAQNNVNSVSVWFYADDGAGRPGYLAYTGTFVPGGADTGNFTVTFSPTVRLGGDGHYWVAVQANKDSSTGQWVWREHSGAQNGSPSMWQNPGGGYPTPCTDWGARAVCFGSVTNPDLAFRLLGTTSDNNAPPLLISLSPAGGAFANLTLNVSGVNFAQGATLQFKVDATTHQLSTNVTSGTRLSAELTAGMLTQTGVTAEVRVTNPGSCGGSCVSNMLPFEIAGFTYLPSILR